MSKLIQTKQNPKDFYAELENKAKNQSIVEKNKFEKQMIQQRKQRQAEVSRKKAKENKDRIRLKKEAYKVNQTALDHDRSSKRDEKFFKNNFSPDRLHKLITQSVMEESSGNDSRDIRSGSKSKLVFQGLFPEIPGLSKPVAVELENETLQEVVKLNKTLSGISDSLVDPVTGQMSLNHTLGEAELRELKLINENIQALISKLPTKADAEGAMISGVSSLQGLLVKFSAMAVFAYVIHSAINVARQRTRSNLLQLVFGVSLFVLVFIQYMNVDSREQLVSMMTKMSDEIEDKGGMEPQMAIDDVYKIAEIAAMALFAYSTSGLSKTSVPFMMAASNLPRFTDSSKTVTQMLIVTVEKVVNSIRRYVLGLDSLSIFDESSAEITSFVESCHEISDMRYHGRMQLSVENAERVNKIWTEGSALVAKLNPRDKGMLELRTRMKEHLNTLGKIRSEFQQSNVFADSTRQVPTCVLIRGSSQVGKSTMTMPLVEEVLAHVVSEDELDVLENHPDSFVYSRMPEQKFWDAYRGQHICAFDDFGQLKDVPGGGENAFSEFIRAGNIFGYPLHMADLEAKGAVQFMSKMIVCTTNLKKIVPQSIVEPEAVRRRFDLVVDQIPRIDYCVAGTESGDPWARRLDKSKCKPGLDKDAVEYYVVDMKDTTMPEGRLTGEVLSYNQLLERLVDIYQRHAQHHKRFIAEKNKSLSEAIERRRKGLQFQALMDESILPDRQRPFSQWMESTRLFEDPATRIKMNRLRSVCRMESVPMDHFINLILHSMELRAFFLNADSHSSVNPGGDDFRDYTFSAWLDAMLNDPDVFHLVRDNCLPPSETDFGRFFKNHEKLKQVINTFRMRVRQVLNKFKILDRDGLCSGVLLASVAGIAAYCTARLSKAFYEILVAFLYPKKKKKMIPQSTVRGNTEPRGKGYVRQVLQRGQERRENRVLEHQFATHDRVLNDIADKVIRENSYEFWSGCTQASGGALFVKENLVLIPYHYVTKIAESVENPDSSLEFEDCVVLKKSNSTIEYSIPIENILQAERATQFGTQDACVFKCPRYVPHHADITSYFMSHELAMKRRDRYFMLVLARQDGKADKWSGEHYYDITNKHIGHEDGFVVRHGYEYRGNFNVGHCGALMMVVDRTSGAQKIIGIHTAGDVTSGVGFATAITQEDLSETLDLYCKGTEQLPPTFEDVELDFNYDEKVLDGRFNTIAQVNKPVHTHGHTEIRRSPLYGKWGPAVTAPARLSPFINNEGDKIDPFEQGLKKYCLPDIVLDETFFSYISTSLYEDIRRESKNNVDFRVYSFREAVEGLIGDPTFKSIPRSKSAGYPHNITGKARGKYKFFGDGQTFDFDNPECKILEARCEQIVKDAKENRRHFHVFCDYLKDERRPLEKVKAGKTRIFSGCPLELLIIGRMYFGAFSKFITMNKINNGCALGVNPYSHDWQRLAEKMNSKGGNCIAGDYSAFDGSEKPLVHWAIKDLIQKFYNDGDENSLVRDVIWMDLINSKHIRGPVIYEWVSSLPSGHFLTLIINDLYNLIAMRYVWFRVHDNDPTSLGRFHKHVYMIVQGDDVLVSVDAEKVSIFNQLTMTEHLAEMGLTFTDEHKSSEYVPPSRPLSEVSFLKRSFRIDKVVQRYVAPLAMETVLETPYWSRDGPEYNEICIDNMNLSLMELSLHGDEVFDQWSGKMIDAYNKRFEHRPLDLTHRVPLLLKSTSEEYEF